MNSITSLIVMLNVIMLAVVIPSVVMPNVLASPFASQGTYYATFGV
jgi:hypothetical protein